MARHIRLVAGIGAAITALTIAGLTATPAQATDTPYHHVGSAGGTFVNVLGGAVRSDLTAGSYLSGTTYPASMSNSTASVDIPKLASVGVVETSGSATRDATGSTLVMKARTAHVSLLDGLITADALSTTSTAQQRGTDLSGTSTSDLVGLTIAGQRLPISVPRNTTIDVPGIAEVVINESRTTIESGGVTAVGSSLKVRLLKAIDGAEPGTVVTINPTSAALIPAQPSDATPVFGYAYVTSVDSHVLTATAQSGPTSYIACPATGTNGRTNVVSLLRVTLPNLVEAGVVETTSNATSVPVTADVTHTAEAARVKLLGGLVTADAVKVTATVHKRADGTVVREPSTAIVNLTVLGIPIRIDANKPNLALKVPGLLSIVVNEQVPTADGITVVGLHVTLLGKVGTTPAGADIKVAVANSAVR